MLQVLKAKNVVDSEQHVHLREDIHNITEKSFIINFKQLRKNCHSHHYTDEIKKIALTLHYFSLKAHYFVHRILALPHSSCMTDQGSSVEFSFGFLINIIDIPRAAVEKNPSISEAVLIVDTMELYKSAFWDPSTQQYVSPVNYVRAISEHPADQQ